MYVDRTNVAQLEFIPTNIDYGIYIYIYSFLYHLT